MTRARTQRLSLLAFAVAASACTATPTILPTNDLNRPTDIAFMCLGAFGTFVPGTADGGDTDGGDTDSGTEIGPFTVSGRPMSSCHKPPVDDNRDMNPLTAEMHRRTYMFATNSASGDLSVVDADTWRIVDLDKSTGGYGRAPLGRLPEQMSASTDGCRLMTANRGSCDLSFVDPSTLLASTFAAQYNDATITITPPAGNGLQQVKPHWPDANHTPLGAAPFEAVFLPQNLSSIPKLCPSGAADPTAQWRAIVTFPSCDLVALIDLPSGDIVASVKVGRGPDPKDATKTVISWTDAGTSPVCAADCGTAAAPADGGNPDGGGADADADGGTGSTTTEVPGTYAPASIAITPDGTQAYVSLAKNPAILSIAVSQSTPPAAGTLTLLAGAQPSVALHDTNGQGSKRIRLGIDPWAADPTGNYAGKFIGDVTKNQRYLYAIAGDGSLRIIDVFSPGQEQECETNFDPLASDPSKTNPDTACIPYGSVPRRQYSNQATSGLRFPTIPIDVAAANLSGSSGEDTVNGGHAWVLTASGTIYLVNINPTPRQLKAVVPGSQTQLFPFPPPSPANPFQYPQEQFTYKAGPDTSNLLYESPPYPNQPRDRNVLSYTTSLDPTLGPTRLDLPPLGLVTGPYVEPLWTQGTEQDATALTVDPRQTWVFFPDRNAAAAQGWDVTWQGTIVSPRYSGILHGNVLQDNGGGFCNAGVLPGDIVTLRGCMSDADCPLGLICDRDQSIDQVSGGFTVTGVCISSNQSANLTAACAPFASTLRRYDIESATQGELTLVPHLDEVVHSALARCDGTPTPGIKLAKTTHPEPASGTGGRGGTSGATGTGGTSGMSGAGGAGGVAGTAGTAGTGTAIGGTGAFPSGPTADNPCWDPTDNSTANFQCVKDANGEPRCLFPCTRTQDCRHGRVCLTACTPGTAAKDCPSSQTCGGDGQCHARRSPDACAAKTQDCGPDKTCVDGKCVDTSACDTSQPCPSPGEACVGGKCVDANACDGTRPCQSGESCVNGQCEVQSFCADGPPLANGVNGCFPQLTSYQVNVNAGFLVTGTQAGSYAAGTIDPVDPKDPMGGAKQCRPYTPAERDRRLVSRIPLRPYPGQDPAEILCGQSVTDVFPTWQQATADAKGFHIDAFNPALKPTEDAPASGKLANIPAGTTVLQEAPQLVEWMRNWTVDVNAANACLYWGGPIASDQMALNADPATRDKRQQYVRARFRNTQVAFVLADVDRGPPGANTIHFDVHGGFRQEAVVNLTTVQISAPARLVLGPIDSNRADMITTKAAPFFFVVDQRRLGTGQGGGPTRGQIVRVNPFGLAATNGYLPVYEDYHASNGLFPIQ